MFGSYVEPNGERKRNRQPAPSPSDNPQVLAPPPVIFLGCFAGGGLIEFPWSSPAFPGWCFGRNGTWTRSSAASTSGTEPGSPGGSEAEPATPGGRTTSRRQGDGSEGRGRGSGRHERRCCPFFRFRLTIEPTQDDAWFELAGGDEVRDYLRTGLVARLQEQAPEPAAHAPPG
jgi:hypothetical protein